MSILLATTFLALQIGAAGDTTPAPAAAAGDTPSTRAVTGAAGDAYLDAGARALVEQARARRDLVDHSIAQYSTVVRDRLTVGVRALRRDRPLYLRETASRVLWRRDGEGEVEVLGGRQALPMFTTRVGVPDALGTQAAYYAFDPGEADLIRATFSDTDRSIRHPLADGSEAHYRFRSGGTTTLRLPDGRTIRLLELQVIPRRPEFHLARGSLWLEADTYALVRAAVRPARPWDLELDGDDDDDVPGFVKPVRAEVRYLAIEYGLWEMRWWLPRLIVFEGAVEAGLLGGVGGTVRYERTYSDFRVTAGAAPEVPAATEPLTECPKRSEDDADAERRACVCRHGRCREFAVTLPADSASLLRSEFLPPSIFSRGPALVSAAEMEQLIELVRRTEPPAWALMRPTLRWSVARQDLLRYNRVEGLSVGARAEADFQALAADATLRVGVADPRPDAELGVVRESFGRSLRVNGYHRLAAVDPAQRPFGLGGSLSALLFGRDDGDYFRGTGIEVVGRPPRAAPQWYRWRVYAEQQRAAENQTDFSVARALDGDRVFRPNLQADRADQLGASLRVGSVLGGDPARARLAVELTADAETGDYRFVRPSLALALNTPVAGRVHTALELAAGDAWGELPAQSGWYLGGAGTVRGYAPLSAGGAAFWRGRAELGTRLPAARLVAFADAGAAGNRDELRLDPQLLSVGAGASLLDGLIRFDLARALRGDAGWRAELYVSGGL